MGLSQPEVPGLGHDQGHLAVILRGEDHLGASEFLILVSWELKSVSLVVKLS